MVTALEVRGQTMRGQIARLNRIRGTSHKMTREAMREFGEVLEDSLKRHARAAGIKSFTGSLQGRGIRYEQRKFGDIGRLKMHQHTIFVDSMRPHHVSVHKGRVRILRWAAQARSPTIQALAHQVQTGQRRNFSIYVRPHPYITKAYRYARRRLPSISQKHAKRIVQ